MKFRKGNKDKFCLSEGKVGAEFLLQAARKRFFKEFGMPGKAVKRKQEEGARNGQERKKYFLQNQPEVWEVEMGWYW